MGDFSVIILCNDDIAIPAIRDMVFFNQLSAVCIPAANKELISDITELLKGSGITVVVLHRESWVTQLADLFSQTKAIAGFTMTFPWKIGEDVVAMAPRGFLNFHYGRLPEYRGPAPIFAQLKNAESVAGLTVHQVTDKTDAGPVVMLEKILIKPGDTYGILKSRLAETGAGMANKLLQMMSYSERLPERIQDEKKACWHKRPGPEDVIIRWKKMDSKAIIALIDACNPWNKGAITRIKDKTIRILEAGILKNEKDEFNLPGKIVLLNSGALNVVTLDHRIIQIKIIYTPEGFMSAARMATLGVSEGDFFNE